jgi:hypothetical protein
VKPHKNEGKTFPEADGLNKYRCATLGATERLSCQPFDLLAVDVGIRGHRKSVELTARLAAGDGFI